MSSEQPPPDRPAGPYGAGPYGPGSYGDDPYGGAGSTDPLAGGPTMPLASLGRRLLARIIDALIVAVPTMLVLWPVMADDYEIGDSRPGGSYVPQLVGLLVYFVYEGVMLSARGQTVGKMLMRIRVTMLDSGALPHGAPAWIRSAVYSLPQLVPCVGFLFWLLNVLFCTWDRPWRQCLHDKAARTVVVSAA